MADDMGQEVVGRRKGLDALHAFVLEFRICFVWRETLLVVVAETEVSGKGRLLLQRGSLVKFDERFGKYSKNQVGVRING